MKPYVFPRRPLARRLPCGLVRIDDGRIDARVQTLARLWPEAKSCFLGRSSCRRSLSSAPTRVNHRVTIDVRSNIFLASR